MFWVLSPGGPTWTEFYESIRGQGPVFVLVGDGWDATLAQRLEENRSFLLARPVQEGEMDRILAEAESRSPRAST